MARIFCDIGSPALGELLGGLLPLGKERIPAQVADMLLWHARNARKRLA
jgi:hypothetical protein